MKESSKSRTSRDTSFYARYFNGRTIDIGCGDDLVVPNAEPFDTQHGDADGILRFRPAGSYDTAYSSHCLEHMRDVPRALAGWWGLVKAGGFLIVAVPDENLYEQGFWPSLFNKDHKATFRLGGPSSWSPVSYEVCALMAGLPGSEPVSLAREDDGYIRTFRRRGGADKPRLRRFIRRGLRALERRGLARRWIEVLSYAFATLCRCPIDQTDQIVGSALAQIEVIVRKGGGEIGAARWRHAREALGAEDSRSNHSGAVKRWIAPP
ncbi:MAG: methyltransferase domain-containing protein [Acetobacteraceae bacterium]